MQTESQAPEKAWLKTIPYSTVDYPESSVKFLRVWFWQAYMPIHYLMRNSIAAFNVFELGKPKDFLGNIAPHLSMRDFVEFLVKKGYKNHFVAWKYKGEVVSLRYVENFSRQYHIRVFENGSVCGHYEYTPESRPFTHMKGFLYMKLGIKKMKNDNHSKYFYELFGNNVIPEKN
ncbi:MAG TPA: hypothetical protein VMV71_02505 [Candidatus Paceibacterota bacterium]|nr:hypothetical protein [Candidatus Paceibacterota bacterium]